MFTQRHEWKRKYNKKKMKNNNKKHTEQDLIVCCVSFCFILCNCTTKNGTAFLASLVKILLKIHNVSFFVWCVCVCVSCESKWNWKDEKTYKNLYKQTLCRLARGLRNNLWSNIYTKKWLIFFFITYQFINFLFFFLCPFQKSNVSRCASVVAAKSTINISYE